MKLTTKNWKEFRIGDLFDQIGKTAIKKSFDKRNTPEDEFIIPALSSKIDNNSFGFYVREEDHLLINRLCLSVTLNGDAGKVYVQNKAFAIAQDAYAIYLKDDFNILNNEAIYLFLATIMEKVLMPKYGYTNKATWNKVKKETLLLPSKNDEPDWDFMEEFIKEIEEENKEKLAVLKDVKPVDDEIDISDWHEFRIEDLFDGLNGDFDIKQKHINNKGDIVITSGVENFGILGKTDVKARLINEKTLTIDMFGNVFYRPYKYKMVTHARVFALIPKFDMSDSIGLFMATIFFHLKEKYSYSNMCSFNKIKNEMILLPAKNDEPDWEYMEDFITNQQEKIKNQLKELRR